MSDLLPPPITTSHLSTNSSTDRRQPTDYPHTPDNLIGSGLPPSMMQQFHATQPQPSSSSSSSAGGGAGPAGVAAGSPHLHSRSILIDSPSLGSGGHPLSNPGGMQGGGGESGFIPDTQRVTRAFGLRVIRTVRRGQLPFLLVFFTCVIIFFSALSGFGYVEPGSTSSSSLNPIQPPAGAFNPGQPVHDNLLNSGAAAGLNPIEEEKVIKMKQLEEQWARQKRPKDGAWMRSNRNQREVRRKPLADSRFQRQREQGGRE